MGGITTRWMPRRELGSLFWRLLSIGCFVKQLIYRTQQTLNLTTIGLARHLCAYHIVLINLERNTQQERLSAVLPTHSVCWRRAGTTSNRCTLGSRTIDA